MSDVWQEASRDLEAEHRFRSLQMAKQASQGAWSFLALAQDVDEYEQRKAIALDALFHAASAHNLSLDQLTAVYDRQFGLLMQAKDFTVEIKDDDPDDKGKFGDQDDAPSSDDKSDNDDSDESGEDKDNPFGKDDDSDDDGDDKGKGGPPVTTKPHQKPSDGGGDDGNGASDDGSDDDDDSDSDKEDDDKDSDDSSDGGNPFAKGSSFKFQALLDKIEAGEDPRFFKVADAAMSAGSASTTPPPMPGGSSGGSGSSPDPGVSTNNATPDTPVTDTNTPTAQPPAAASSGDNTGGSDLMSQGSLGAIEADIRHYNPDLPEQEVQRVARVAYQKLAGTGGESPLLYGDRGNTADGPMTSAVKNFSPPNLDGSSGGDSGSEDSSGGDSDGGDSSSDDHQSKGGGGGGGSGMAGAAAGAAMRVLPELLMASLKAE